MKTKQRAALALSILCLLAWGGSLAEDSPLTAESFSLRNGYIFGMSAEEAMKLAEEEGLEAETPFFKYFLVFQNVPVGNYVAETFELLFDATYSKISGLCAMVYNFEAFPVGKSGDHAEMYASLKAALIQKYGEPTAEAKDGTVFWNSSVVSIALGSTVDLELDCKYYYVRYSLPLEYMLPKEEPLPTATDSLKGL